MKFRWLVAALGVWTMALILASCTSTQQVIVQGAGATFYEGLDLLSSKKYEKAREEFNIVVKQYPASAFADSAQFYLAETYYKTSEYLTAAFEFSNVTHNYPSSKLVPEARFRIADCYKELSPRVQLDQANTKKAIQAFQSFIDYYPDSPLVPKAEHEITLLRNKLALKNLEIAKLYMILGYYRAAVVYYDVILERYHDSDIADKAAIGKVKALIKRHRDGEASIALRHFYDSFPHSSLVAEANDLARKLRLNSDKADSLN